MSTKILSHVLPSDFEKHKNASWQALEHRWRPPFLLTTDNFGAATNVWRLDHLASTSSNEQGGPQPILLNPSLPPNPFVAFTTAHIVSPNERFLAIALSSHSSGSWRVYELATGSLISECSYSGSYWESAGGFAATSVTEGDRKAILRYTLTDAGKLEQVGCVVPAAESLDYGHTDSFGLLHLATDGSIFTSTSVIPSTRPFNIAYYPPHTESTTTPASLDIPFTTEGKDAIFAKCFIQVSERSLGLVVEENEWGADMRPITALSTVRLVTYTACPTPDDNPNISLSWTTRLEHAVDEITYVPSLGAGTVVVRGQRHAPYAEDGSRDPNKLILTFLDASTGTVLKQTEQTIDPDGNPAHRCIGSNWVVYDERAQTPWVYSISLARVMEIGLEGVENSKGQEDVQVTKLEVRNGPEPWNSKARKSAEKGRWSWVKDVEVLSDGKLVLFSEKGPEFWVLDSATTSCA